MQRGRRVTFDRNPRVPAVCPAAPGLAYGRPVTCGCTSALHQSYPARLHKRARPAPSSSR
eukprot:9066639-Alexandrium_andersonii.AAC.1